MHLEPKPPVVWTGIYPDLASVPAQTRRFVDATKVARYVAWTLRARALSRAGKPLDVGASSHEGLCVLAAMIAAGKSSLHVLDFGGATGLAFVQMLSCLRVNVAVRYDVVDLEEMCFAGAALFADDPRIQFHTAMPVGGPEPDIVYASTVLQYIDDYAGMLGQLAARRGRYLFLNQLAAGQIPTYAAMQMNEPRGTLPYWFLNINEVIEIVESNGYSLIYEDRNGPAFDQSNYPETHRIGPMRALLFVRSDERNDSSQESTGNLRRSRPHFRPP